MPEFQVFAELLMWIATGGGAAIIVGRAVSLILEDTAFWHQLSPWVKKYTVRFLALVFGVVAEALLEVDLSTVFGQFAPVVGMIILAAWNWLASQTQYLAIKETRYAEKARANSNIVGP